ncbi:MAG: hypothetical protein HY721_09100 [Planctomycetes bacterium]|nr:hypothetical protein [Planctomycetota bacterium]
MLGAVLVLVGGLVGLIVYASRSSGAGRHGTCAPSGHDAPSRQDLDPVRPPP